MQALCLHLSRVPTQLPSQLIPFPIGKAVQLLHTQQCNAPLLRQILACAQSVRTMLTGPLYEPLIEPMLALTSYETGMPCTAKSLLAGCERICALVESVVALNDDDQSPLANNDQIGSLYHCMS